MKFYKKSFIPHGVLQHIYISEDYIDKKAGYKLYVEIDTESSRIAIKAHPENFLHYPNIVFWGNDKESVEKYGDNCGYKLDFSKILCLTHDTAVIKKGIESSEKVINFVEKEYNALCEKIKLDLINNNNEN